MHDNFSKHYHAPPIFSAPFKKIWVTDRLCKVESILYSTVKQWCPNKKPKGPHSIGAKNSSIQNVWKILRPKGPVVPAGHVLDNTALQCVESIRTV